MTDRAFILAGGLGTRLAPYTTILPKPLMPIHGSKSIIEHVIHGLTLSGITDITISIGYLGHLIEAVLGDGERFGVRLTYLREQFPLGTAGSLGLLPPIKDDHKLVVVNGDTYTDFDYHRALAALNDVTPAAVACTTRVMHVDYGVLTRDRDGKLSEYSEKPQIELLVSMGIYALMGSMLDLLEANETIDMPDFLRRVFNAGHKIACVDHQGEWKDLGRPSDFALLQELDV